ncbi:MAG: hypothetical protein Kow0020_01770 [Wenzhouxiangellaceae bacterium]
MRLIKWWSLSLALVVLGGCGEGAAPISNDRLLEAHAEFRTGIWVSAEAPVAQLLSDQTIEGKPHQRFTIRLTDNIAVQIWHSLPDSERVPVQPGDVVRVHGYYQWDPNGGVISKTYSDPGQPGGGGWIEHKGRRYD